MPQHMCTQPRVGFIGLGSIGGPMARCIARHECAMVVHDLSPAALARMVDAGGGRVAASPSARGVAQQADVIFLSLPSLDAVREVVTGAHGLLSAGRPVTVVDLSTTGAAFAREMHAAAQRAGAAFLDAPVSGGIARATEGSLTLMCSGAQESYRKAVPYLEMMGRHLFYVGQAPGIAQTMKLVNNTLLASAMTITFEAMVFGVKAGLDPDLMIEILNTGTGRNYATLHKVPESILTGTFDSGGNTALTEKDLRLYLDEAREAGAPMWATSGLMEFWAFAMSQGAGPKDNTTAIQFLEQWAGVQVRGRVARERAGATTNSEVS